MEVIYICRKLSIWGYISLPRLFAGMYMMRPFGTTWCQQLQSIDVLSALQHLSISLTLFQLLWYLVKTGITRLVRMHAISICAPAPHHTSHYTRHYTQNAHGVKLTAWTLHDDACMDMKKRNLFLVDQLLCTSQGNFDQLRTRQEAGRKCTRLDTYIRTIKFLTFGSDSRQQ